MSWFSELTSKAEAMLVKLDQNTAEALQNPDKILKGNKILDQAISSLNSYKAEEKLSNTGQGLEFDGNVTVRDDTASDNTTKDINVIDGDRNLNSIPSNTFNNSHQTYLDSTSSHDFITEKGASTSGSHKANNNDEKKQDDSCLNTFPSPSESSQSIKQFSTPPSKKFTIQTSKSRSRNFTPEKRTERNVKMSLSQSDKRLNGVRNSSEIISSVSIASPHADDIRASINRSLQEYTLQSSQKTLKNEVYSTTKSKQISYSSHFDDQPNLVQYPPLLDSNQDDDSNPNRLRSSQSFSIDVPDDQSGVGSSRNDIASRLLKQSALKKKSTFYLHKVINRIAYPNGQESAIISDQMKIRLRRAQMRAASYGRRLNYYFRAYPNLKYVIIIYLILMQILVVYVLIFYQSSSSSSDLSTQIKKQQQEMAGTRYD